MRIPSNYYPKYGSVKCYFRKNIRGYVRGDDKEYRGRSKKHTSEDEYRETQNIRDKKSLIRVTYGNYPCLYIGHYDKEKYNEQMIRYRQGMIKSRPNGRRWCKLPRYLYNQCRMVNDPRGKYIKFRRYNGDRSPYWMDLQYH